MNTRNDTSAHAYRKAKGLPGIIKIHKFAQDKTEEYLIDQQTSWANEILCELQDYNAEYSESSKDDNRSNSQRGRINFEINIHRKTNYNFSDHVLIRGKITCEYYTPCVRCLEPSAQVISTDFSTCFLGPNFKKNPEYQDVSEIFYDQKEMELYFYRNGEINLAELIHEQVFLAVDYRPLHDPDCKGLCPICGINLNKEHCPHQK